MTDLAEGIKKLLPAAESNTCGPVSGTVFKVERGTAGEKVAYVRMFSGVVRTRDKMRFGPQRAGKVTAVSVFDGGSLIPTGRVAAGQIGKLWGPTEIRIGDSVGDTRTTSEHYFAPPTLETVVVPSRRAQKERRTTCCARPAGRTGSADRPATGRSPAGNLRLALRRGAEKEVIQATLASDYGIEVAFQETTTICIERPAGSGGAVEFINKEANPFLATVGLRVDPAPIGGGVSFRLGVELGSMPYSFFKAVEETVHKTLLQGLYGWQVTDCMVTMTHSGYLARQSHSHGTFDKSMSSTAGDFRNLTPLVLLTALENASSTVYEPMHSFRLELPADTVGPILPALARLRARPETAGGGRPVGRTGGRDPRCPGARAAATTARPDPRRGRPGKRVRAIPAGQWSGPASVPLGPQPTQPQGVSAACRTTGLARPHRRDACAKRTHRVDAVSTGKAVT